MILKKIITSKNLAWDKRLEERKDEYLVNLSSDSLNELVSNREKLNNPNINDFKFLQKEIVTLKQEKLLAGYGFFIINGSCLNSFSKAEQKLIYVLICNIIGDLIIQNIEDQKLVEIKDKRKSLKTGGRYHQTRDGGSYHTDSPQWQNIPDYIGLFCVNPAKSGGTSKFSSVYTIHNKLLNEKKDSIKILYNKFHFDKRGEFKKNESPTTFESIFQYKDGKLSFRYLRDYIENGHKIQNNPLSAMQINMLDSLDKILHDEDISISYDLKSGDIVFSNNHRIVHGRTGFEDHDDENMKRCLIRVWIKEVKF